MARTEAGAEVRGKDVKEQGIPVYLGFGGKPAGSCCSSGTRGCVGFAVIKVHAWGQSKRQSAAPA
jgi:hypothetical protein